MITMWGLFHRFREVDALIAAVAPQALAINALVPERARGPASTAEGKPGLALLLAGSLARQVVGIGELLAAGPMARSLARAAASEGMEEALLAAGLSPAYATFYVQGLRGGGVLLAVTIEDAHERTLVGQYRRAGVEFLAGLPAAFPAPGAGAVPDPGHVAREVADGAGHRPTTNAARRYDQMKGGGRRPKSSSQTAGTPPGTGPGTPQDTRGRAPGGVPTPGAKGRPAQRGPGPRSQARDEGSRGRAGPSERDPADRNPAQDRHKPPKTGA